MIIRSTGSTLPSYQNMDIGIRGKGKTDSVGATPTSVSSFADALRNNDNLDSEKTDHIEISCRQETESDVCSTLCGKIRAQISTDTAPDKLNELTNRIGSGNYTFASSEMARILLTSASR